MQTIIWEFLQTYPYAGVYTGMPAVEFDADAYTGFAPLTVNFDASTSYIPDGTASVSTVSWEILREGDATPTTDSGLTLAETFTNPGIYHVTAIATSSNGRVSPALKKAVRVSEAPSTPMIGINFNADQGGSIAANEYAGIARQLNWNNYAGRTSGSIATLLDNAGNPSGSLTLSCPSGYKSQDTFAFPEPDFRLLHGFVRNDSSTALVIALTGLPAAFSDSGYQVIVYSNAFPNLSTYPDNRQILVDWGNNGTTDQTLTGLAQWAMPDYDEVRPDYDYSDASGAPQFYHLIDIPSGHTAFSLTIPAGASQFAISGIQVVAGP
jgi:PKD repeat protein